MAEDFGWPRSAFLLSSIFLTLYLISPLRIRAAEISTKSPDVDNDDLIFDDLEGNSKYVVEPVSSPGLVDDAHIHKRKIGLDSRQSFTDDEDYLLEEGSAYIEPGSAFPEIKVTPTPSVILTSEDHTFLPNITPPPPIPVYIRIHLNITNLMYTPPLEDRNSPQFDDLAKEIERNMKTLFDGIPGDQVIKVLNFSPFPLMVAMDLGSVDFYDEQTLYRVFQDAVARGNIGPYTLSHLGFQIRTVGSPTVTVTVQPACAEDEYACPSGECVNINVICDGKDDCADKSDEYECEPPSCRNNEFKCDDGACISNDDRCNDRLDCPNGEDELGCSRLYVQCRESEFQCYSGKLCVEESQHCDGYHDCPDGSDETHCTLTCGPKQYQCLSGACIDKSLHCNQIRDCTDGSDEEGCPSEAPVITCGSQEFQCRDNYCIPNSRKCDGTTDCSYGEDEHNCQAQPVSSCLPHEFQCNYGGPCLDIRRRCDGNFDCSDRSDEDQCIIPCRDREFRCSSGQCIDALRRCDGVPHCTDSSDEINCPTPACRSNEFQCLDGSCISQYQKCDKIIDCGSGEDEINCPEVCKETEFRCVSGQCVDDRRRCDGRHDCPDGSDELACENVRCRHGEFQCASGIECIDERRKCDHHQDCSDGSDEQNCKACRPTEFQCHSGECIDVRRHCDTSFDCADRSDEIGCAPPSTCRPGEFRCNSGHCIVDGKRCDGIFDCADRSDEDNCADTGCGQDSFRCDGYRCLDDALRCDGQYDCADRTDEEQCPTCRHTEFQCPSGHCLDSRRKCDGYSDCPDGSDEHNCEPHGCAKGQRQCTSGECINEINFCDNRKDCRDGSDEFNCPGISSCRSGEFRCNSGQCIDERQQCDNYRNCADGSDELNCAPISECKDYETKCKSGECVDSRRLCDGYRDCTDGSDEDKCLPDPQCKEHESPCHSGECIDSRRLCDGYRDCSDGSDEEKCKPDTKCKEHESPCRSGECIDSRRLCDGYQDCADGSDEEKCKPDTKCKEHESPCRSGECIDSRRLCDGYQDCADGSDEDKCKPDTKCKEHESPCRSGECIDSRRLCDGYKDCADGSDEEKCKPDTKCKENESPCHSGECIDSRRFCDGYQDCSDGSDEEKCSGPIFPHIFACSGSIDEFRCDDGACIEVRRKCNDQLDCRDGTDEENCPLVPPIGVPSAPQALTISGVPGDPTSVYVYWQPPEIPSGVITGYLLLYSSDINLRDRDWTVESLAADQRVTIIKDLSPTKQYFFKIQASNAISYGSASEVKTFQTPSVIEPACTSVQFQCQDGFCIDRARRCDGRRDCRDASDEVNCDKEPPVTCDANYFQCRQTKQCVDLNVKCDGKFDCDDYTDESDCPIIGPQRIQMIMLPESLTIPEGQEVVLQCLVKGAYDARTRWSKERGPLPITASDINGRLTIADVRQEDAGVYTCTVYGISGDYRSDVPLIVIPVPRTEKPFPVPCTRDEATCRNGQCIQKDYICDGDFDCDDRSDELSCVTILHCEPNEFKCDNDKCVQKIWRCDGDDDCGDSTDERNCGTSSPGTACRLDEYKCATQDQCIPKSFHCDGQIDCQDRSDEIGCSPPTVIRLPPERLTANVGQTIEIVCEAIGIPTPLISWRLNWGNIPPPPRVTTTSENGRGVLVIRNVMESDQGAYSCEAINIKDSIIASPDTILSVEVPAGICTSPTFNAGASSSRDCIQCFCFGITQQCSSSSLYLSQIPIGNEITLVSQDTKYSIDRNRIQYRPTNREFTLLNAQDVLRPGQVYYWNLPRHFLGNKLSSYGGSISYSINYRVSRTPIFRDHMDVILKGSGMTLNHRVSQRIEPGQENRIEVLLRENLWLRGRVGGGHSPQDEWASNGFNGRGDTPIRGIAGRDDLMTVLKDLESIQIRASYDDYMSETSITNIIMDTAVPQNTGRPRAVLVEECRCPPGYTGLSCESCAVGFKPIPGPSSTTVQCTSCNCHGHSNDCDPQTGECRNCQHNTMGSNCDRCRSGYYGDARQGRPTDCQSCSCPLSVPSNQFSPTCFLSGDGSVTCDSCAEGHTGRRCEICLPGFIGNPSQPGDRCRPIDQLCNPWGSISSSPDSSSGQCLCKQFAVGPNCDQCAPNTFHLSDVNVHGCIACFCMGITQSCSSSSWHRTQTSLRFHDDHHGVILNDMKRSEDIDQGLTVNTNTRQLIYRNFKPHSETLFWQLPEQFLGNKLTAYGGYLRFTIHFVQGPGGTTNPDADVELLGNSIFLIYKHKDRILPNTDHSFQVPLLEHHWQREDGMIATREHMMMVLADLDVIFIKATYSTNTAESSLRDITLDLAEDRQTGQARALMVEQCHCPPGYKGLSCEDCDFGYTRSGRGLYLGFCETCSCHGHSNDCDPETGVCRNCQHNTEGETCDQCSHGFYGDPTRGTPNDCQPCPCPLTSPPNQFSPTCILDDDGLPTCSACQPGHTGRRCERCIPPYSGEPLILGDSCRYTNGTCACDRRGSVGEDCDTKSRACQCKTNVRGPSCDQCSEGYFHLDEQNPVGCTRCFCFGITTHCSSSNYYRDQTRLQITSAEAHNFALANRRLTKILTDGFVVNLASNEILFRSFTDLFRETYFWVLPPQFRGDKVTSYAGVLKYTQSFRASTEGSAFADVDVEIIGNDLRLFYVTRPPLQEGETRTYEIPLHENDWRKVDSRGIEPATREDFMMVLADVDSILIRASFHTNMISSSLRSVEMDIATPQNTRQPLVNAVEVCRCPEGYAGLSCQDCAAGYQRDLSSGPYLGRCVQCNCNGHSDICDPSSGACVRCQHNTDGDRCELCLPGYYGDATVGTPNDCRLCPCPLTITSNRFSPTCYLDTDGRPTCDACPVGYSGRDCGTCAPGYTGDPRQPGDSCQPQADGALVVNVYPKRISENIGATVKLNCQVGGSSSVPFNVRWTRQDNTPLPLRAVITPDHSLTIQNLQNVDQGRYFCIAASSFTEVQDIAEITVIGVQPSITVRIEEPKQITADDRSTVTFRCTGLSQVTYTLVWTKEGGALPDGATDNNGILTIPNVRPEDSGTYLCIGSNLYNTAQDRAYLNVGVTQEAPKVRIEPRFQTVNAGDPVEFRCIATGFPFPELEWTGGPGNVLNPQSIFTNGLFRIPVASRDDEAEYFCHAKSTGGTASVRTILFVKQNGGAPQVTVTPSESDASIGSVAQFECQARGHPTPTIIWTRPNDNLPHGATQENGILIIPDVQESYRGYYICTGTNIEGSAQGQARLNVVTTATIEPTARIEPERQTIGQHTTGVLRCVVGGDPQPTIRWLRHGGELTANHQITNDILRIVKAEIEDRGYYICIAENLRGSAQASAIVEVEVREHPAIEIYPEETQSIIRGGSALFQCRIVGGIPAPSLRWTRAGNEKFTETTEILNDGVIRFNRVTGEEQGTYICTAENEIDVVNATAILRIQGVPHVYIRPASPQKLLIGQRLVLECVAEGDPTPTVSWQRFDTTRQTAISPESIGSAIYEIARAAPENSGLYICIARNAAGVSEARMELLVEEHYTPSQVHLDKDVIRVPVGGSAEFHCRYVGVDHVQIQWSRSDGPMPSEHSVFNGVLQIPNVKDDDAGEYSCHGIQDGDVILFSASATLEVITPPRAIISPPSQIVAPGDYVRFHCQVTGNEPINIEWAKLGGALSPTAIITNDYLEIRQATTADSGQYRCIATSSGGRSEAFTQLIISVSPTVRVPSRQETVSIGSTIDLRCETTGNPTPILTWTKDGEELPPQHSIINGFLRITNVREEDSGRYICTARNDAGVARDYVYVTVQSHQKVEVLIDISKGDIQIGDSVDFVCKVLGAVTSQIHWTRVDAPMPNNAQVVNNILRFNRVRFDNGGLYRCTAYTSAGPVSADAVFTMQASPDGLQSEQTIKAPIGSTVNLQCSAPGYPQPIYSWSRQEGLLPRDHASRNGILTIPKVRPEDAGSYMCTARNPEGAIDLLTILIITDVVPSFGGAPDSYIRLPAMKDAYNQFDIRIAFKPDTTDGLLIYNGQQKDGGGDFLSFGMSGGRVEFRFDVGAGPAIIRSEAPIQLGQWHTVSLRRDRRDGFLIVDDSPAVHGLAKGTFQGLDLVDNMYIGGVPDFQHISRMSGFQRGFTGCVGRLIIGGSEVDVVRDALDHEGLGPCPTCDHNPCSNAGICQEALTDTGFTCLCPAGYTGPFCEASAETCYQDACGTGRCDATKFGVKCYCPLGKTGPRCEQDIVIIEPAFAEDSYIAYDTPMKALSYMKITMTFKPRTLDDGILMYCAQREDGNGDFISLTMKNQSVEFRFDTGSGPAIIRSPEYLKEEEWTRVTAERTARNGALIVNDNDPVTGTSSGETRGLNLRTPLFIGGVDAQRVSVSPFVEVNHGFHGCISHIEMSDMNIDLIESVMDSSNIEDCGGRSPCEDQPCLHGGICRAIDRNVYECICQDNFSGLNCEFEVDICQKSHPCQNGGTCVGDSSSYTCNCILGFSGTNCQESVQISDSIYLRGNGYLELSREYLPSSSDSPTIVSLSFATNQSDGLLLWHGQGPQKSGKGQDYVSLSMKNGFLVFSYELGSGPAVIQSTLSVNDGKAHTVTITRRDKNGEIEVDATKVIGESMGVLQMLNTRGNIYIGGLPDMDFMTGGLHKTPWVGCLFDIDIQNNGVLDLFSESISGVNVLPCEEENYKNEIVH